MKLLVAVIFVLALLYIFFTVIGPAYIWQENPEPVINGALGQSETDLGHYNSATGSFADGYTVQAIGFESDSRSIVFECNNPIYCCEEDGECDKTIKWSNSGERYFAIQEDKEIDVSTRCRYDEIYICKVFLGAEPAQVDLIKEPEVPASVDLAESNSIPLNFTVLNTGENAMSGTTALAKLFKIKKMPFGQEPEKLLVEEFSTEEFFLSAGDEIESELGVEIPGDGDFLIEFTVSEQSDETNFESREFEFKAVGEQTAVCVPGEVQVQGQEKCVYLLPCNCPSITECTNVWRSALSIPKEEELELVSADDESVTLKYLADYSVPDWCDPETMECEESCQEKEAPEPICTASGCIEDKANCRVWLPCRCDPGADPNACREIWTKTLGARNFLQGTKNGKPMLYLPGTKTRVSQEYCECHNTPQALPCCELPAVGSCGGNTCPSHTAPTPPPQTCTDGVESIGQCVQDNSKCQLFFPCVCLSKDGCINAWKQNLRPRYPGIDSVTFNEYKQGGMTVGVYVVGQDNRGCDECEEESQICLHGILGLEGTCRVTG